MNHGVEHPRLSLHTLPGLPLVEAGDDLAQLICTSLNAADLVLREDDVIVLAQKIVSKSEGRSVRLADVTASAAALELATRTGKDARLIELILSESQEIMRVRPGLIVVRHRLGMVLANAGIDQSNVAQQDDGVALLLPLNPDASCAQLRGELLRRTGVAPATMIIDSLGRAWRNGTVGTAIGACGLPGLLDLRGQADLHGRALQTSELGYADEIAAAASLLMGQASEGRPAVLVRGLSFMRRNGNAAELIRPKQTDLFP